MTYCQVNSEQDPLSDELLEILGKSAHICVLTGAGVSVESGLATFRGPEGIWSKFKPEELASIHAFLRNPELVWRWYEYRRDLIRRAKPNPAHIALVEWESISPRFTLITQNVDGLHQQAGSIGAIELHGNIRMNKCVKCTRVYADDFSHAGEGIPCCDCGGMLRPAVVWFGEALPEIEFGRAIVAAESCDLFVTAGTSAQVYPAASLPEIAQGHGATIVEVNAESTAFSSRADFSLRGRAGLILPILKKEYQMRRPVSCD